MATRSLICRKNEDGSIDGIYCHNDGYVKGGVGECLYNNYKTKDVVDKLIALGDLSFVGREPISSPEGWQKRNDPGFDFDAQCLSYADRGEKNTDATHYESEDEIDGKSYEFIYTFDTNDNTWYVKEKGNVKPLADYFKEKTIKEGTNKMAKKSALKESRKGVKYVTEDGKEIYITTQYGSGYQVASSDGFGDFNPWQQMKTRDEVINGEKYNFVVGYETMNFNSMKDALDFAEKQYGKLKKVNESCKTSQKGVKETYSYMYDKDKEIYAYCLYDNAVKKAQELGLKEAEYGDVYNSDVSYCYWNKSGNRNDDEEVMCYYMFDKNGKPKKSYTQEELDAIIRAYDEFGVSSEDYIDDIDDIIIDESCKKKSIKETHEPVDTFKTFKFIDKTEQGFDVVKVFQDTDDNRLHIIAKRPKGDFVVGLGYNPDEGYWNQGRYDFTSQEDAEKYFKKNGYNVKLYSAERKEVNESKRLNEVFDSKIKQAVWDYMDENGDVYNDKMFDLLVDLVDRVDDYSDDDSIDEAIDSGMIYTDDQWTAYRYYCEIGDPEDNMWEGLYGDVHAICDILAGENETEEDDIEESCKKQIKESKQLKNKRHTLKESKKK